MGGFESKRGSICLAGFCDKSLIFDYFRGLLVNESKILRLMQTIIHLIKVTKLNKELLKGKTLDLIEGIEEGRIASREDARALLFNDSAAPEQALTKFLRRTKRKLNLSILTSFQPSTHLQEILKEVYTTYSSIMLMLLSGHRKAAIPEARRIYNIAVSYELLEVLAALGSRLAKHYAESAPNPRLSKRFAEEAEKHAERLKVYTLSNKLYSELIIWINNRSSYSPGVKNKAGFLYCYDCPTSIQQH